MLRNLGDAQHVELLGSAGHDESQIGVVLLEAPVHDGAACALRRDEFPQSGDGGVCQINGGSGLAHFS